MERVLNSFKFRSNLNSSNPPSFLYCPFVAEVVGGIGMAGTFVIAMFVTPPAEGMPIGGRGIGGGIPVGIRIIGGGIIAPAG